MELEACTSTSTTTQSNQKRDHCPLLSLPQELIDEIFGILLYDKAGVHFDYFLGHFRKSQQEESSTTTTRLKLLHGIGNWRIRQDSIQMLFRVNKVIFDITSQSDIGMLFNPVPASGATAQTNWPTPLDAIRLSPAAEFRIFSRQIAAKDESEIHFYNGRSLSDSIEDLSSRLASNPKKVEINLFHFSEDSHGDQRISTAGLRLYLCSSVARARTNGAFNPKFIPYLVAQRGDIPEDFSDWSKFCTRNIEKEMRSIWKEECKLEGDVDDDNMIYLPTVWASMKRGPKDCGQISMQFSSPSNDSDIPVTEQVGMAGSSIEHLVD